MGIEGLTQMKLLGEIRKLFWIEPGIRNGKLDEGWSCYDIALMSGVIARCLGFDVDLVSGKAIYVSGPSGALSPLGLEQDPHCWIHVHGHRHVDLSPKLAESSPSR